MRARTWRLSLNLDEFNAAVAALQDEAERGQFLTGLSLGMNQGRPREGSTWATEQGFHLGQEMRREAEAFRVMKAEVGKKGGRPSMKPIGEPTGEPVGEPTVNPSHKPQAFDLESRIEEPPPPSPSGGGAPPADAGGGGRASKARRSKPQAARLEDRPAGWSEYAEDCLQDAREWAPKERFDHGTAIQLSHGTQKELRDLWAGILQANPGVTARELKACWAFYIDSLEGETKYVQLMTTFFGSGKATWMDWLNRARQAIADFDSRQAIEAQGAAPGAA